MWKVKTPAPALSRIFARKLGISQVLAQLLINRGIHTIEQGRLFLSSELESLHHPLLFSDMKKAVTRILKAIKAGEKILVYGDYDADGLTATALLANVFRHLGREVDCYVPNRLIEGYGLHLEVLQKARENGTDLVITVDCGISALSEARWAGENDLDLIITDHHEPPAELPPAFAVINPKIPGCEYPFKELAGVGVALKLAQALLEAAGMGGETWQEYLDLACLGTIADIVPVHGENRILVKHGLPVLANTKRAGLEALIALSGVKKDNLGPREVGFGLAPRLNAAGRIGSPSLALRLLLTDNAEEARELACELNRENQERQKIESAVLGEALGLLEERPDLAKSSVITLASDGWHSGVIGIVASRLADRFYRPVVLVSLEGPEGRGSARSIPDFNIYKALNYCEKHLLDFGGHEAAAGFTIKSSNIESFFMDLNKYAEQVIGGKNMVPRLDIDGFVDIEQISEELVNEIEKLRPFGHANPGPLLGCRSAPLMESRGVGKGGAHLKLRLRTDNTVLDGIGFNLGAYAEILATAESVDLAFVPEMNEYNGKRTVQLEVKDLGAPAVLDPSEQHCQETLFAEGVFFTSSGEQDEDEEELFIPEFILKKLRDIRTGNQPVQNAPKKQIEGVQLVDYRNSGDRPALLPRLVNSEPMVVITSCSYQTIELAHHIQLARPDLKGKVAYCHDQTGRDKKTKIVTLFKSGQLSALVSTPEAAGPAYTNSKQVLLYHLPYSPEEIRSAINYVLPGGRLYLLYSDEDFHDNLAGLESLAPGREYLASLYHLMRREKNRDIMVNINRLKVTMARAGFQHAGAHTVKVAFTILGELGLLNSEDKGEFMLVHLFPAPSDKKDLFQSQTYRLLHEMKEESVSFMRKFLSEPLHNLLTL